jgi:hypothetical protein
MVDGVRLLCRDEAVARDVEQFLSAHPLATGQRTVNQIVERLGVNIALTARLQATLGAALTKRISQGTSGS